MTTILKYNIIITIKNLESKIWGSHLSLYLNTTTQSVYRFFKGESTPSIKQLVMICDFLDITIYQLIGIEDKAKLSNEELEIIKAIRDGELNNELVKRTLNLKYAS